MKVVGITAGFSGLGRDAMPQLPSNFGHDAAAALVADGCIVAAVEEERLIRLKHTSAFCREAVRDCLDQAGLGPSEVDFFAYYFGEEENDRDLELIYLQHPALAVPTSRELLAERLGEALGEPVPTDRIRFVRHHTSHGFAAWCNSGFDSALVAVMDGKGDSESITMASADGSKYEYVRSYDEWRSLGRFYQASIELLGYRAFDEYKVMGLAPYGDAGRYRDLFRSLYTLDADGDYHLDLARVRHRLVSGFRPRRRGEPFTQEHKDFAAGLQESLEDIALHVITAAQRSTGHRRLCVGGGVGLNATLNGRLMSSGLFDAVYFDPAAHDAGAAVGAAMWVCQDEDPAAFRPSRLRHLFLGPRHTKAEPVAATVERWDAFVTCETATDVYAQTAAAIADGAIVGWIRGRSEFGPRALGHRSIVADPRPESNKDRINAAVKKREAYRPFAPSVVEEEARRFFDIPEAAPKLYFMIATALVRPQFRSVLAAVTHVDGTARLQVVDRATNGAFWRLIREFGNLTGVPVLLNTSFNNNAEPIVQTVEEAVVTFLTTDLDLLVVDDYLIRKRTGPAEAYLGLVPSLGERAELVNTVGGAAGPAGAYALVLDSGRSGRVSLSEEAYELLCRLDGRSLADLGVTSDGALLDEFRSLWSGRFLAMRPA